MLPRWTAPASVGVVLACRPVLRRVEDRRPLLGVVDWIAHLATGVVLIAALRPTRKVALGILVGSVVIDLDHVPHELGSTLLKGSAPRPYPHNLFTLLAVLLAARMLRSRLMFGTAIGLAGHLGRDLGTGDGVLLLWPLSRRAVAVPHTVYVAALTAAAAVGAR